MFQLALAAILLAPAQNVVPAEKAAPNAAGSPIDPASADPIDRYIGILERTLFNKAEALRRDVASAKKLKKRDLAQQAEKELAALLAADIFRLVRPKLDTNELEQGQVGVLSGVVHEVLDETTLVIESKSRGRFITTDVKSGDPHPIHGSPTQYIVGSPFESFPSVVHGTMAHGGRPLPVVRRLDMPKLKERWQARQTQHLAAEETVADAAAKAKRDAVVKSTDDIARAKLDLARKATKPETRLRLLREIVQNYPASQSAAEAEKLLAQEQAKDDKPQ